MDVKERKNQMRYVALANGLNSKRSLVPAKSNIQHRINRHKDFYVSIFKYNQEHFNKFKETQSLSGMDDVIADKIVFDFDDKLNLDVAKQDTVELCNRLLESGIASDKIVTYFSGNKGFHVEVKFDSEFSRQEFINIQFNMAEGLSSFDDSINDCQRILRVPLTKHPETGLYKIPLSIEQLNNLSSDEIRNLAKDINNESIDKSLLNVGESEVPEAILEYAAKDVEFKAKEVGKTVPEDLKFDKSQLDLSKCPRWLTPERYALQEGFFYGSESVGRGERNDAFMILASTYKKNGFNRDMALNMLEVTAQMQAARTGESERTREQLEVEIINTVYADSWAGGTYGADHPLLVTTRARFDIKEKSLDKPKTILDITDKFKNYVKNIDKNTIKTGIPQLDNNLFLSVGTNVSIVGAPGSGKSSIALEILRNTSVAGIKSVFASLDMSSTRIYEKILYKLTGNDRKSLYDMYKQDKEPVLLKEIEKNYGNVFFYDKSQPTVADIRDYVLKCEEASGEKVKLVMIDYFERVFSDVADDTASSKKVAGELQNLVNDLDICLITLVQPNKMSGDLSSPINSYLNIKGSSFLAQSFRIILGIYREGYSPQNPENDRYLTVNVLKNDLGEPASFDFHWVGNRGEIYDLEPHEKEDLEKLRAAKKMMGDF